MLFEHPAIVELAEDPEFRARLLQLRARMTGGEAMTLAGAAAVLGIPYPMLAAIYVEQVLTTYPEATVSISLPRALN